MPIQEAIQTIEDALKIMGHDPSMVRNPPSEGAGWVLPVGKTILFIGLSENEGRVLMRMHAPILFMPPRDLLSFYRRMLDLNAQLVGVSLGMTLDVACVFAQQALDGASQPTVGRVIQETIKAMEVLPDLLFQEFQSARYWSPS